MVFGPRGLHCDNRPSPELEYAFMSMDFGSDWNESRMLAAAHLTFPNKMSIHIEKGKYAQASDGYSETKYLYITPEYKAQALASVNKKIESEIAKVSESEMAGFEKEYKKEVADYKKQRKPYIERQQIEDELDAQEEYLEAKSNNLISVYAQRIDAVDSLNISKEEKQARKAEILAETEAAVKEEKEIHKANETKRSKLREENGWITLKDFDQEYSSLQDKERWMRDRIIRYAREENEKVWEEFRSKPREAFDWPDTSHLPTTDLQEYYAERDTIESYQEESSIHKEMQSPSLTDSQQEVVIAFATAYFEYVTKGSNYRTTGYFVKEENTQNLRKALQDYFTSHYSSVEDNKFMQEFEKKELPKIAEQYSFYKDNDPLFSGFGRRKLETDIKFENGIIIGNVNYSKKVYYGDKKAINDNISELESKVRFYKDLNNPEYFVSYGDEKFLSLLKEYRDEHFSQKSLTDLDNEKQALEEKERKAKKLLQQYEQQYETSDIQHSNTDGISIDGE